MESVSSHLINQLKGEIQKRNTRILRSLLAVGGFKSFHIRPLQATTAGPSDIEFIIPSDTTLYLYFDNDDNPQHCVYSEHDHCMYPISKDIHKDYSNLFKDTKPLDLKTEYYDLSLDGENPPQYLPEYIKSCSKELPASFDPEDAYLLVIGNINQSLYTRLAQSKGRQSVLLQQVTDTEKGAILIMIKERVVPIEQQQQQQQQRKIELDILRQCVSNMNVWVFTEPKSEIDHLLELSHSIEELETRQTQRTQQIIRMNDMIIQLETKLRIARPTASGHAPKPEKEKVPIDQLLCHTLQTRCSIDDMLRVHPNCLNIVENIYQELNNRSTIPLNIVMNRLMDSNRSHEKLLTDLRPDDPNFPHTIDAAHSRFPNRPEIARLYETFLRHDLKPWLDANWSDDDDDIIVNWGKASCIVVTTCQLVYRYVLSKLVDALKIEESRPPTQQERSMPEIGQILRNNAITFFEHSVSKLESLVIPLLSRLQQDVSMSKIQKFLTMTVSLGQVVRSCLPLVAYMDMSVPSFYFDWEQVGVIIEFNKRNHVDIDGRGRGKNVRVIFPSMYRHKTDRDTDDDIKWEIRNGISILICSHALVETVKRTQR